MPKHLVSVMSLIAAVVLLLMLNFTTPTDGPLGVLVFFTTVYVVMLGVATKLVKIFQKIAGKQVGRKTYLYGAVIAFGPIMLLLAQSLGSMSVLTVGLVVVFVLLGCFLVNKRG